MKNVAFLMFCAGFGIVTAGMYDIITAGSATTKFDLVTCIVFSTVGTLSMISGIGLKVFFPSKFWEFAMRLSLFLL